MKMAAAAAMAAKTATNRKCRHQCCEQPEKPKELWEKYASVRTIFQIPENLDWDAFLGNLKYSFQRKEAGLKHLGGLNCQDKNFSFDRYNL